MEFEKKGTTPNLETEGGKVVEKFNEEDDIY